MVSLPENLILWSVLIAPGFFSMILVISIGVVERELPEFVMLVSSILLSILIDVSFLGGYQLITGDWLSGYPALFNLFFVPYFRADLIFLIFLEAAILGIILSVGMIRDTPEWLRSLFWQNEDFKRHHWQPWEGTLRNANVVQVFTADGQIVKGLLGEYSRVDRSKEIRLDHPEWWNHEIDGWESADEEAVLLLENDITRIMVLDFLER